MKHDDKFVTTCYALLVGILIGLAFGLNIQRADLNEQAVRMGHAEYNIITGKWQWKTNCQSEYR